MVILLRRRHRLRGAANDADDCQNENIVQNEGQCNDTYEMDTITPAADKAFYIGLNEHKFTTGERQPCFAAFIAYSHKDRDFVIDKIYYPLQKLLHGTLPDWDKDFLTVLYDKHFLPGQCIMDVCRVAVFHSYVTVPIISDAFSSSTYCHHEIELAIEARAPIVPVYIPGVHTDRFPAVVRYIYENNVRILWPDTTKNETLTKEELSVVRDLTYSIATYVKQQIVSSM